MDLYVERQCIEQMKKGNTKQFLLLYEACFADLYRYVSRRVVDHAEIERVVKLTFLDAVGQVQSTPNDVGYLTWLYSLAKPRVWSYLDATSFPHKQGLIDAKKDAKEYMAKESVADKARKMFAKLSLEEKEILKLKFFEEVTDGDIMTIIGSNEGAIGAKIYKVLKRAHFLLFGESDARQGVYFGELSSFLGRFKSAEKIEVPEAFKLSLRAELSQKIDRKGYAVEAEKITVENNNNGPKWEDFSTKTEEKVAATAGQKKAKIGSDDPAKIFVETVNEIRKDDKDFWMPRKAKEEQYEQLMEVVDKWKSILIVFPVALFVVIASIVTIKIIGFERKIPRVNTAACKEAALSYDEKISDADKKSLEKSVLVSLCQNYKTEPINVAFAGEKLTVEVLAQNENINYVFAKTGGKWQIIKYAKTSNSDQESGKIPRDN